MQNKLELSSKLTDYLSAMPEQGMGYQIVNITLKNGLILKERIILNSTYLILNENEQFNVEDIESITIYDKHKNK